MNGSSSMFREREREDWRSTYMYRENEKKKKIVILPHAETHEREKNRVEYEDKGL